MRPLQSCSPSIERGVDLRGYWCGLPEHFEWAEGYSKRLGIVFVESVRSAASPSQPRWYSMSPHNGWINQNLERKRFGIQELGDSDVQVSEISLGTWALGGEWGTVGEDDAYAALNRAVDLGVNFLDTADVYGDGRSERLIGRLLKDRPHDEIFVATKAGRRLDPHLSEGYGYENLSAFVGGA